MTVAQNEHRLPRISRSRRALAIPVTFMILFVSMLGVISITYYFAVEKINTRSTTLKIATAKQDMLSFDDTLTPVLWQPGAARTFEFSDSGGQLNVQPQANSLILNVADNRDINATIFSGNIGQVIYELPYAESPDTGLYLKGDSRTITYQSGSVITQLYIRSGPQHPETVLRYRPTISYTTAAEENNKAVNDLRIYIVNLNASDTIAQYGKLPLRVSCIDTQTITATYDVPYAPENLLVTSTMDGVSGQVSIPIASTSSGAVINVEVVICNIQIQRCVM